MQNVAGIAASIVRLSQSERKYSGRCQLGWEAHILDEFVFLGNWIRPAAFFPAFGLIRLHGK